MWLEENKITFISRDLRKEALSAEELQQLAATLPTAVVGLLNTKSQVLKKINPDLSVLDEAGILALMLENPRIIKRPILSDGQVLTLGFNETEYRQRLL